MLEKFVNMMVKDKITDTEISLKDIIENRLPVAVDELDFSHIAFDNEQIPDLSFIEVSKKFDCSYTNIVNLSGFPNVCGILDISNTLVESLEGCPENVKDIEMSFTNISSFKGCPIGVEVIDAWKTRISTFEGISPNIKALSVGRTLIRDLSKTPRTVEELTADYLDVETLDGLPENLKSLSIAGSFIKDFMGMPHSLQEIVCYENENLESLNGLNIETLKGIAITGCPKVLDEEIEAYHEIIRSQTLLEKNDVLDKFLREKEFIIKEKRLAEERLHHK